MKLLYIVKKQLYHFFRAKTMQVIKIGFICHVEEEDAQDTSPGATE